MLRGRHCWVSLGVDRVSVGILFVCVFIFINLSMHSTKSSSKSIPKVTYNDKLFAAVKGPGAYKFRDDAKNYLKILKNPNTQVACISQKRNGKSKPRCRIMTIKACRKNRTPGNESVSYEGTTCEQAMEMHALVMQKQKNANEKKTVERKKRKTADEKKAVNVEVKKRTKNKNQKNADEKKAVKEMKQMNVDEKIDIEEKKGMPNKRVQDMMTELDHTIKKDTKLSTWARKGLRYCKTWYSNFHSFLKVHLCEPIVTLLFTVLLALCIIFFTAILEYAEPKTKDTFTEHNFKDIFPGYENILLLKEMKENKNIQPISENMNNRMKNNTSPLLETLEISTIVNEWEKNTNAVVRFMCAGMSSVLASHVVLIIYSVCYLIKHILVGGSIDVLFRLYNCVTRTKMKKAFYFKQNRQLIFKAQVVGSLIFIIIIALIRYSIMNRTFQFPTKPLFYLIYGKSTYDKLKNPYKSLYTLHSIEYLVYSVMGFLFLMIS